MKIHYDSETGEIRVAAIDSEAVPSPFAAIADNTDILMTPNKYVYKTSTEAVEKRPYIVIVAGSQNGNTIPLTITAYTKDDEVDTSSSASVAIYEFGMESPAPIIGSPISLSSGVGSIDLVSGTLGVKQVLAQADGKFCVPISVTFS